MTKARKIYGVLVAKNEANRYLEACLAHMMPIFDQVFVFDDLSIDGTPDIARSMGCEVAVRSELQPSFVDHEGRFRQSAWVTMYGRLKPKIGDWAFAFDADEFLVGENVGKVLRDKIDLALHDGHDGLTIQIPEVFGYSVDGEPMVRTDGFWKEITGVRAAPIRPGMRFRNKAMGCGSVPDYATNPLAVEELHLLHYGYAEYQDRCAKYDFYSSLTDSGHNPEHINSILTQPMLRVWEESFPKIGV